MYLFLFDSQSPLAFVQIKSLRFQFFFPMIVHSIFNDFVIIWSKGKFLTLSIPSTALCLFICMSILRCFFIWHEDSFHDGRFFPVTGISFLWEEVSSSNWKFLYMTRRHTQFRKSFFLLQEVSSSEGSIFLWQEVFLLRRNFFYLPVQ